MCTFVFVPLSGLPTDFINGRLKNTRTQKNKQINYATTRPYPFKRLSAAAAAVNVTVEYNDSNLLPPLVSDKPRKLRRIDVSNRPTDYI